MLPVGIHRDIPYSEYHAHYGLRSSHLKVMLDGTPRDFQYAIANHEEKSSDALLRGGLLHAMLLEPHTVRERYILVPEQLRDKAKKVCNGGDKETWDAYKAMAEEQKKPLIDYPIVRDCLGMAEAIRNHGKDETNPGLWHNPDRFGQKELTLIAEIEGVMCKVRLDCLLMGRTLGGTIFDIKSIAKAPNDRNLQSAIADYSYHLSAAMYVEVARALGLRINEFVWVWVNPDAPHHVRFTKASQGMLETGRNEFYALLKSVKTSRQTGIWQGYGDRIDEVDLPDWYFKRQYFWSNDE